MQHFNGFDGTYAGAGTPGAAIRLSMKIESGKPGNSAW